MTPRRAQSHVFSRRASTIATSHLHLTNRHKNFYPLVVKTTQLITLILVLGAFLTGCSDTDANGTSISRPGFFNFLWSAPAPVPPSPIAPQSPPPAPQNPENPAPASPVALN
jgi:hypothetical protein